MKDQLLKVSKLNYASNIEKHRMNLEVLLNHPQTIPEHTGIMQAIDHEVTAIAEYMDKLEVLVRYFKDEPKNEPKV